MRSVRLLIITLSFCLSLYGQQLPNPMIPFRLVNDFTGLLTEQQQIELNNKLLAFNNETSTQIYVVTYDSLQGYPINEFGYQLGEKWGIGRQGKNNGILILISPANRKITIQTGYGLEGAVPDAVAKRLIENILTPSFREGNYYAGIDSSTNVLISLTRGEFTADDYMNNNENFPGILFIIILVFLFIMFSAIRTRRRFYSPTGSIPWWMMGSGSSKDSGWGSFTSGGGRFGGGGSFGSFGGGGGGSFGGGGASGGW
jgi:uncharacterized protein